MAAPSRPIVRGWLVAPIAAIALFVIPVPPRVVDEFYSRDLYPWIQSVLTAASNQVPWAVMDILLVVAAALVLYRFVRLIMAARRGRVVDAAAEAAKRFIRITAGIVVAFMLFWGFNYRRLPLETTLEGSTATTPTEPMLVDAVDEAVGLAVRLRPQAMATMPGTNDELAGLLAEPMNAALARLHRGLLKRLGRPKTSRVLTPYFTAAGVDGMINPLALESIIHADLLPFERPFVLAHEWAHLAGHGDEAEASAVGWLACMNGPPALAYSASLYLVMEGGSQLRGEARSRAFAKIDRGVREDFEKVRERLSRQQPRVRQASYKVYDQYLKANRVEEGAASYSRAVSVILSEPLRGALRDYQSGM